METSEQANHRLYFGDNLDVLATLAQEFEKTITLVYLDPPFFTKRQHQHVSRAKKQSGPPERLHQPAFDDRWDSFADYLASIKARLKALKPLLAPHGSIVLHVDTRTSHYLKVIGDEIYGIDSFASEIIWRYRRWPAKTQNFQRVHDVLLRWVADSHERPRFVQQYEELSPSTLKTWGKGKQRAVLDQNGRRLHTSIEPVESPGVPLGDVWDIPIIAPVARERTGYPTQKPEALLSLLIKSCTIEEDWILDPYVGSGTSIASAAKLGRKAIGIDSSPVAIETTRNRMKTNKIELFECIGTNLHQQNPD
ncbi:MAG: site-specific DNA-methyltransferase [Polyangiaceae bacterium]|nr:site-specific DNA-methyltransferase [Polyangiaceae bacterium]